MTYWFGCSLEQRFCRHVTKTSQ